MKKSSTTDFTKGNIAKQIIVFAIPIFLGQVFQCLYNSADSIIVGNLVGKTALAAVSASADISAFLIGFFTGFSTGGAIVISRYFGAHRDKELHNSIHTLITFSLLVGGGMAAIGILLSPNLLDLVDCPSDVYEEALSYLRIYLLGVLFTAIYNVGASVLRAVGDSQRPFIYLVVSSLLNIVLDLIFVGVFQMGVAGAAWATIIAQLLSVVMVFVRLIRAKDVYQVIPKDLLHMDGKILKEIAVLGFPAGIQACLISISNLFVQKYINAFGSAALAGIGAGRKIDNFVGIICQCLGLATSTFVSQNIGAKKLGRAFKGIRVCIVINIIYILVVGTPIFIFAREAVSIFTDDAETIQYGMEITRVMIPFYVFMALNQVFANAVRGFGKSVMVTICSVTGMIVIRQIFLAIMFAIDPTNIWAVYYGFPLGWICAALGTIFCYFFFVRRHYRHVKAGDESPIELIH